MLFKKSKAILAGILSAAMVTTSMATTIASAATTDSGAKVGGTRTKAEAFGDDTYAARFLSLYDDVITNGQANGYLSSNDGGSGSFGIPYHAVEEVIVEAPDYGHETTSEAMSYLVWAAAMRDNIAKNHADQVSTGNVEYTADLAKAWKTMEVMVPDVQDNFWTAGSVSSQYCGEYDTPEQCPDDWAGQADKTAENPIYSYFTGVYKGKNGQGGLYLMHWLGDVDNWYGYGEGTSFTFINTFQRGEQESCWETVPHPCVETKKYGTQEKGLKGIFNQDQNVTAQYAYTNAPDAEDRAIQGVFDANQWNVGDDSVTAKAAEMGDELRNNMYDKYYQAISENTSWSNGNAGDSSKHYLMNWYTSWGGALASSGQNWCWQIGCSHAHEFYQNPLAAYALVQDAGLSSGMKSQGAKEDYVKSLERQMEFYLWLQSANGPIAGGATNSYKGRYEAYPAGSSTFYGMMYVAHPVYGDPVSNNWIGNQVWAVQRLAELYYWVKTNGDTTGAKPGGMSVEEALEQILDKWCTWFVNNTVLTEDGDYYIPSGLTWTGQPDTWNGSASDNGGLTCEINGYGNADFGCVASLANTLIYYANAKGVTAADIKDKTFDVGGAYPSSSVTIDNDKIQSGNAYNTGDADVAKASLYLAQQLLDREWNIGRDNIGLTRLDHNGSFARMFSQGVWVSTSYGTGKMPNGDEIKNGINFLDIRSMYLDSSKCAGAKTSDEAIALVQELKAAYEQDVANGAHFADRSDLSASSAEGSAALAEFTNVASVDLYYHRFWHAGDIMMALGTMANLYPDLAPTIQYNDDNNQDTSDTTENTDDTDDTSSADPSKILWGDANVDGTVDILDIITMNKTILGQRKLEAQGFLNSDVDQNKKVDPTDSLNVMKLIVMLLTQADFPIA
ncbi:MAG: cellulose 1,4-beta-cellobiosidase [Oscillospiraceae bacterium]|nr:cellulose 1,4-beta-cellobiosidase [Oscillospiraceae bacterium]